MIHGSLESGLGGFDYAADMIGWENIFHCEINPFCRTILNYYWPNAKSYADIFEFDGLPWRGKVDIITAGFPCQPFSQAGKRKGTDDDRHIWPENLRIIKEIQPPFVLAENVPGLLTIERGLVFETVCADLENEGYEVTPFIIPACATGAVHRRDRIWIVAYSNRSRGGSSCGNTIHEEGGARKDRGAGLPEKSFGKNGFTIGNNRSTSANVTDHKGRILSKPRYSRGRFAGFEDSIIYATDSETKGLERNEPARNSQTGRCNSKHINGESWIEAATRLCCVDDELTGGLDTETISKPKWRTESLKAYGNAIYWPVAYEIFKAIDKIRTGS